nr:MAG TPA: hypothetical protein [Caudoviricetes sp.]
MINYKYGRQLIGTVSLLSVLNTVVLKRYSFVLFLGDFVPLI